MRIFSNFSYCQNFIQKMDSFSFWDNKYKKYTFLFSVAIGLLLAARYFLTNRSFKGEIVKIPEDDKPHDLQKGETDKKREGSITGEEKTGEAKKVWDVARKQGLAVTKPVSEQKTPPKTPLTAPKTPLTPPKVEGDDASKGRVTTIAERKKAFQAALEMDKAVVKSASPPTPVKVARDPEIEKKIEIEKEKLSSSKYSDIKLGKKAALAEYKIDYQHCSQFNRGIIFKDIKSIESTPKNNLSAVKDLMFFLNEDQPIDLSCQKECAQLVLDTIEECNNKETNNRLVEWLVQEKTFHVSLLKGCLDIFIRKQRTQVAYSSYALEQLIKIYQERAWNQIKDAKDQVVLPSGHSIVVSALSVLITEAPNRDEIKKYAEWMICQPDYDLKIFNEWIHIFIQREIIHAKSPRLYYPLLDQLIENFYGKWGEAYFSHLDPEVVKYLQSKKYI